MCVADGSVACYRFSVMGAVGPVSERVSVVLLNWKGASDTIACVESLLELDQRSVAIYICDNSSPDNSVDRILAWAVDRLPAINAQRASAGEAVVAFRDLSGAALREPASEFLPGHIGPQITLIQTGANIGYAAGNNVGMRFALAEGATHCWILNNDTEVERNALSSLLARTREDPTIGMCGSTLVYYDRRDMVQNLAGGTFNPFKGYGVGLGFGGNPNDPVDRHQVEQQLAFVSGASMLVTREFLETVGLMSEDYFLYYEELDWAFRAKNKYRLGYAPDSVVYHKVGASIGTEDFGDRPPFSEYYLTRNRVKFCARHSPVSLPYVLMDVARQIASRALVGQWNRAGVLLRALFTLPYVSIR